MYNPLQLIINLNVENTKKELQAAVKQVFLDLKSEIDKVEKRVNGGGRKARINGRLMHSKYICILEPSYLERDLIVCSPLLSEGEGNSNFENFQKGGTWQKIWGGGNQKGIGFSKSKGETQLFKF